MTDFPNAALREQFLLDDDWHFLNHGSFGACPRPVFAEYQRWQRELESQPVHFMLRRLPATLPAARERLAKYINADPANLIFATNATSALNLVIRSLKWQSGDEILSSNQEYGALQRTWDYISQRDGVRFRPITIPTNFANDDEFVERIWSAVTTRTRAIFLSHITSPTALLFPLQTLIERARAANILTIIDGAHAPGQIPLDMSALGADAYAGNCHKWLCAPKGSAFLHVQPSLHEHMIPSVISHDWQAGASFTSSNNWYGTQDFAAYLSVPAALDFLRANDWEQVRAASRKRADRARRHFVRLGYQPVGNLDRQLELQLFALQLPSCDTDEVYRRLWEEHRIEVPVMRWQEKPLLRISIQAYNTDDDWLALAAALTQIFSQ